MQVDMTLNNKQIQKLALLTKRDSNIKLSCYPNSETSTIAFITFTTGKIVNSYKWSSINVDWILIEQKKIA